MRQLPIPQCIMVIDTIFFGASIPFGIQFQSLELIFRPIVAVVPKNRIGPWFVPAQWMGRSFPTVHPLDMVPGYWANWVDISASFFPGDEPKDNGTSNDQRQKPANAGSGSSGQSWNGWQSGDQWRILDLFLFCNNFVQ